MRDCWFLVLDDVFGASDPRNFGGRVSDMLAERVGKWTILTSNLTMPELASKDRRLASRMIRDGSVVVENETKDYALRPKIERQRPCSV